MDKIDYNVTKTNLYEQIADSLEQAIMRSEPKLGTSTLPRGSGFPQSSEGAPLAKLPSEQELSKRFNVSRTVIREALKVLKERGLIQSRNGEGSYISRPNADIISSAINRIIRMDHISNDKLHSMRLILETAGARLAAVHITEGELKHLEDILEEMTDLSLSETRRIQLDAEFHITIAQASKNELMGMFIDVMTILLNEYMIKGISGPEGIKKTLVQHRKILEAFKERNPELAETSIWEHLTASRENVGKFEQKSKRLSRPKKVSTAVKSR
ncbi:GntR family transcriptional regulator [Spirochaetia bacterium]|nr:GntR family transcriptional regulator [Spirochaetia bacterium]